MRRLWLLALPLVLSLWTGAAEIKTGLVLPVPPLVLGPAADAANPLWKAVAAQSAALQGLPGAQAAAVLKQAAASLHPLEALSAQALARAAVQPAAAQVLQAQKPDVSEVLAALKASGGMEALVRDGGSQPALDHFFDGTTLSLGFEDISTKGRALRQGKAKLQFLGAGEFGAVYVHPNAEGAVIKAVEHGFEIAMFDARRTVTQTADEEEVTSRALASAGAGPRYLGRAVHQRRELSVRERIYGQTMTALARDRKFGEEERALVLDMLRAMAKAGLLTDDKRPPNIMIGRTLLDPRRRAYLVDGGHILPVDASLTEDQLYEALLHQITIVIRRMDPHMGPIEISKPFSMMLDEAVHRSRPMTRWERFWDGVKGAFQYPPGAN